MLSSYLGADESTTDFGSTVRRWLLVAAVCCACLLPARSASAFIRVNLWEVFALGMPYTFEPVFPDMYYEWDDSDGELVLAWPLAVPIVLGADDSGGGPYVVTPFVEYQWALDSNAKRGMLGVQGQWIPWRTDFNWGSHPMVFGVGPRVEAAGILATDGHGGAGGVGLTLATFNAPMKGSLVSCSLMYRQARTPGQTRHAVTVDFHSTMLSDILFGRL